jgi:hypothetical protein
MERWRGDGEPKRLQGHGFSGQKGSRSAGGFEREWDGIMRERKGDRETGRGGKGDENPQRWRPCADGSGTCSLREKSDQPGMDGESGEGGIGLTGRAVTAEE